MATVVDLLSRRAAGWWMSVMMTAQFVTDALMMAVWRRGKPDVVMHHSDRGSQHTSQPFQPLMAEHGITPERAQRAQTQASHAPDCRAAAATGTIG